MKRVHTLMLDVVRRGALALQTLVECLYRRAVKQFSSRQELDAFSELGHEVVGWGSEC